jgi:CubicO group peptidase (beta-lactamase class C family)
MRRLTLLILTLVSLLLVRTASDANDLRFNWFREYLQALRLQAGIPGVSALVVEREEIVWEDAFGLQNINQAVVAQPDTPYHLDGTTQIVTTTLLLRCVEEGKVSIDDRLGTLVPGVAEPQLTLREILTHTTRTEEGLVFDYQPERFDLLVGVLQRCAGTSFRQSMAGLLDRLAMRDSVPGPDALLLKPVPPPLLGFPRAADVERYARVMQRLAIPYAVDTQRRPSPSEYLVTTLTPSAGLVTTVRDLAQFDLALRKGLLLRPETVLAAWEPPIGRTGVPLPHGMGWFTQTYRGERVVWQFGVARNSSSSLVISVPGRGLTLVLLANSSGLVQPFALSTGDLTLSPFGRVFLALFLR